MAGEATASETNLLRRRLPPSQYRAYRTGGRGGHGITIADSDLAGNASRILRTRRHDEPIRPAQDHIAEVAALNEQYNKRLVFDTEPRELVRLLRGHAKAKAGPFAWKLRHEGRELGLFLVVQKSNRDGFEGTVSTILYRKPGGSFLAQEGELVATLHGTRVRQGETLVLMKCPEPKAAGWLFANFALGMEQLQQELAEPAQGAEAAAITRSEAPRPQERATRAVPEPAPEAKNTPQEGEAPAPEPKRSELWLQIPDSGWDRIAVRLVHEGYTSGEIARKIEKGIVAKTVEKRLSTLRAVYGPEVVPYRRPGSRKSG